MIKLVRSFVNENVVLQQVLPDKEHVGHLIDTVVNKFYTIGRGWLTTQVAKVQPPRMEPRCCLPINIVSDEAPYMHVSVLRMRQKRKQRAI